MSVHPTFFDLATPLSEGDSRETSYLFQQLLVALQKASASEIVSGGAFNSSHSLFAKSGTNAVSFQNTFTVGQHVANPVI